MPTPESTTTKTDPTATAPADGNAPPGEPEMDGAADPEDAEEGFLHADASLQKLEGKLDDALSDLGQCNRSIEEYLDVLAQQRKQELQGANANQLTIDDIPQPTADVPAAPGAAPAAPPAAAD